MGLSHAQARKVLTNIWPSVIGGTPSLAELQAAQSVGAAESQYGAGWGGECAGSNNWGAVQSGRTPCGPGSCEYTDTHPNPDGTSTPYQICFRTYATPEDGAAHMLRVLFTQPTAKKAGTLAAARSGSLEAFSRAMYSAGYYEGFGATKEARQKNHYKYIKRFATKISEALGEPLVDDDPGKYARPGSTGGDGGKVIVVSLGLGALAYGLMGRS